MSGRQVKTAVRVANVPANAFEAAVESDDPRTHHAAGGPRHNAVRPLVCPRDPYPNELRQFASVTGAVHTSSTSSAREVREQDARA